MKEFEHDLEKMLEVDELRHQGKNIPIQHEEKDWEADLIDKIDKERGVYEGDK